MADFVAAIDQGTTSTRCMLFDQGGNEAGKFQLEHEQILPQPGWVEHNPVEIWERTTSVLQSAINAKRICAGDLAVLGITNQRETTLVWNKRTGRPYYNAIVWQDTRTDRIASALDREGKGDVIRNRAGIPPATYFSAAKVQWILENVPGAREDAEKGPRGGCRHARGNDCEQKWRGAQAAQGIPPDMDRNLAHELVRAAEARALNDPVTSAAGQGTRCATVRGPSTGPLLSTRDHRSSPPGTLAPPKY